MRLQLVLLIGIISVTFIECQSHKLRKLNFKRPEQQIQEFQPENLDEEITFKIEYVDESKVDPANLIRTINKYVKNNQRDIINNKADKLYIFDTDDIGEDAPIVSAPPKDGIRQLLYKNPMAAPESRLNLLRGRKIQDTVHISDEDMDIRIDFVDNIDVDKSKLVNAVTSYISNNKDNARVGEIEKLYIMNRPQ